MTAAKAPARGRLRGLTHVLQYNWPYYVLAAAVVATALCTIRWIPLSASVAALVWLGVSLTLFWTLGSVLVTFYVYDLSPLYQWQWLAKLLNSPPGDWVTFHAGLDETSAAIRILFPGSRGKVFDIYDSTKMSERSIERARARSEGRSQDAPADISALPVLDSECDAVFLIFAAHEIRDPADLLRFFGELRRILKPNGKLVLVEHLRDTWNFVAYGPGFRHFFSKAEWLRVSAEAGLPLQVEQPITPFVRCFIFGKASNQ